MNVSNISALKPVAADENEGKTGAFGSILLAEDNLINQKVVSTMLEKAGYHTSVVQDGKAAVEAYISAPDDYSLILMDIQMPKLNGIDAARAIRQWEADRVGTMVVSGAAPGRVCIIAVTAGDLSHDNTHYVQADMDDLLLKPIRSQHLLAMIDKWLNRQRQNEETS